jgi:hypothetical protein
LSAAKAKTGELEDSSPFESRPPADSGDRYAIFKTMNSGRRTLLEQVESWPRADQEELATSSGAAAACTGFPTRSAAVRAGINAARQGDLVPDEEMDEFYRLHHRG